MTQWERSGSWITCQRLNTCPACSFGLLLWEKETYIQNRTLQRVFKSLLNLLSLGVNRNPDISLLLLPIERLMTFSHPKPGPSPVGLNTLPTPFPSWLSPVQTRSGCCSVTQSCLTLWPRGLQHTRPPCSSPSPTACSNLCPLNRWCHPTISSPVAPFYFCVQSVPASGSFQMSQLFISGGQNIGD